MRILVSVGLSVGASLLGQATYQSRPQSDKACPRIEAHEDTLFKTGGKGSGSGNIQGETNSALRAAGAGSKAGATVGGAVTSEVMGAADSGVFVNKGERVPASTFAVLDAKGKTLSATDLKGKVLVVGFWQTTCGPSMNLLNELVDFQAKGEKFNFEVWPVSLDDSGWAAVTPFLNKNQKFFQKTRFFLPSLGSTGPSVFMKVLPVLPALFILDKEGNVAFRMMGYEANALVGALKKVLVEK